MHEKGVHALEDPVEVLVEMLFIEVFEMGAKASAVLARALDPRVTVAEVSGSCLL